MRSFLPFLAFALLIASCQSDKPDYQKLIQGNWECNYIEEEGDTLSLNLYFSDSICHLFRHQDNLNVFHVKNDIIEIKTRLQNPIDYPYQKHVLKIIQVDANCLKVIALSGALNDKLGISSNDTLTFEKIKKKNNLQIHRVSFYSSGCNGCCPSIKLELNANRFIQFEGDYCSDKEGTYVGKCSPDFWKLMLDKVNYIDFDNWKENYDAGWTDDQTCLLLFNTNKGVYKVSVYGDKKEPRVLRNTIRYILSNYEHLDLTKTQPSKIQFKDINVLKNMNGFIDKKEISRFVPTIE